MDPSRFSIPPQRFYDRLKTAAAPLIIEVRRSAASETDDTALLGTIRQEPHRVDEWRNSRSKGRAVVLHCMHPHEVCQTVVAALRLAGTDAWCLDGGHRRVGTPEASETQNNRHGAKRAIARQRLRSIAWRASATHPRGLRAAGCLAQSFRALCRRPSESEQGPLL